MAKSDKNSTKFQRDDLDDETSQEKLILVDDKNLFIH